jgi:outer membrane protein OmpA-like peptidoglycan-associated protein
VKTLILVLCAATLAGTVGCARTANRNPSLLVPTQETSQATMQERVQEETTVNTTTEQFGMTTPLSEIAWRYDAELLQGVTGQPQKLVISFNFPTNSSSVDDEARGSMVLAKQKIEVERPVSDARVLVIGFADRITESSNAATIAKRRAEVARDQLVSLGFRRENIQLANAAARFGTALEHEKNKQATERRVELWLVN